MYVFFFFSVGCVCVCFFIICFFGGGGGAVLSCFFLEDRYFSGLDLGIGLVLVGFLNLVFFVWSCCYLVWFRLFLLNRNSTIVTRQTDRLM